MIGIFVALCLSFCVFLYQWYFITIMICFSPEKKHYLAHYVVVSFILSVLFFSLSMRGDFWAKQAFGILMAVTGLFTFYYALIIHDYMDFIESHDFFSLPVLVMVLVVGAALTLLSSNINEYLSSKKKPQALV
ncbi:MAG: hypothetical protein OEZ36_01000 [Spirochaetota bacterium]|nr:hypothetical protein [Spirochaetota bacterium]